MTEGRFRLALIAIVFCAALAYWPVLGAPYYLDDFSLLSDPAVQQEEGWRAMFGLERTRPLTYLTFRATFGASGGDARIDHATNLALFLALVVAAGFAYQRVMGSTQAVVAATVLALHPAATEAVAYVFARASLLAALLCICVWLLWLAEQRWLSVGVFALALLAKEEAAGFILFLAAFETLYRRLGWEALRSRAAPFAAMAALVAVSFLRVVHAVRATPDTGALGDVAGVSSASYFWTQGRALWVYLVRFVLPLGWNSDHDFEVSSGLDLAGVAAWIALGALAAMCVRLARVERACFWPVGALLLFLPTSSVLPLGDAMADRRMLLPLIAVAPAAASLFTRLASGRRLAALALLTAVVLGGLTHRRARIWSKAETLLRDAVAKSPRKARPLLHLARALEGEGGLLEREGLLRRAISLEPHSAAAAQELGLFLLTSGRPREAVEPLRRAVALDAGAAQALANLGAAYYMTGAEDEADQAFQRALEVEPCSFDARNNLILLARARGESARAGRLAEQTPPDCPWSAAQTAAMEAARAR